MLNALCGPGTLGERMADPFRVMSWRPSLSYRRPDIAEVDIEHTF